MERVDIRIVTAVWGDWHLDAFLDVNLPTLLAPRNLPAMFKQHRVGYQIYTRSADLKRIRAAHSFRRLAALVPVKLKTIPARRLSDPIAAHVAIWQTAVRRATRAGSFALLMPPDVLWSEGSLEHVAELLSQGKQGIFVPFLRVTSNSFLPAFRERFGSSPDQVALSGRSLVRLCLQHLHPLMAAYSRTSRYFPTHAEMIVWPVPGEGIAVRVFARELLVFNPRVIRVNAAQLVENPVPREALHLVADSDQLFGVSLAPLGKDIGWHSTPWRIAPSDVARWWLDHDSPSNDAVAAARVRWHVGSPTERLWRARETAGDLFVRRAALEREVLRLVVHVSGDETARAFQAIELVGLSLLNGRLIRALRGLPRIPAGTVFAFLPEGGALDGIWSSVWLDLANAKEGQLERVFRDHVALSREADALDQLEQGRDLELEFLSGARRRLGRAAAGMALDGIALSKVERVSLALVLCYTLRVLSSDTTAGQIVAKAAPVRRPMASVPVSQP